MKKIRSKITLVIVIIVVLPLIPISALVFNLINQSYRMGVNPQVRQALENGLYFSKDYYDKQRVNLSQDLEKYSFRVQIGPKDLKSLESEFFGMSDTTYWILQSLRLCDEEGNDFWRFSASFSDTLAIDQRIINEVKRSEQNQLIVSDRKNNIYTAVQRYTTRTGDDRYLILRARMKETVLERADQLLQVNQIYQSLDLTHRSLMKSYLYTFIVIVMVLIGLAVGSGIMISSRITSRISDIVRATAELGRGNLDYRLPSTSRKDELSELIAHFNRMAQQLKENQERLVYLEKMAAWQQMARKIAHEIKNPLTPIQLTIQQLVDKYDGSDADYNNLLQECAVIINEEIGSLRQLVTEFSEFGRLPELIREDDNLTDLIREVAKLYGGRITLDLPEKDLFCYFDRDRIRRVLINLLENAVQSDPDNHPIMLGTKVVDNAIWVYITDQGEGIAEDNLNRIFEPYYSNRKGGTGLGLAITRLIMEEHGGLIKVESAPRKGSTFQLIFPKTEEVGHG